MCRDSAKQQLKNLIRIFRKPCHQMLVLYQLSVEWENFQKYFLLVALPRGEEGGGGVLSRMKQMCSSILKQFQLVLTT